MRRVAESHHAKFLVFFNDQSYRDGDSDSVRAGTCVGYGGDWYRAGDMPSTVRETFEGIRLIALSSRHPDVSLDNVSVSREDRHLSGRGYDLAISELTDSLINRGWAAR